MRNEEVMDLPGKDNPVLCNDGKFGMLVIYPHKGGLCGVQVHGEEDIRWISADYLSATQGGALRQSGSPSWPPEPSDPVQAMLAIDWASRGGICP